MEVKPTNHWRILKIGPISKSIKKRKKMSEVAARLSNEEYLESLNRYELYMKNHLAAIAENQTEAKENETIIIEDDNEEESSDCESEHMTSLNIAIISLLQKAKIISQTYKKKKQKTSAGSTFTDQRMQQNEATIENPGSSTESCEASPPSFVGYQHSTSDTKQTDEELTKTPPKEHLDQSATIQCTPNPTIIDYKSCTLRDLLEKPTLSPKKKLQHKYEQQMIVRRTSGGVPMDLSSSQSSTQQRPSTSLASETPSYEQSGSDGNQMPKNLVANPQIPSINSEECSGGYSHQQAYSQHVENETIPTAQSTLNLKSLPGQSVFQHYVPEQPVPGNFVRFPMASRDPRNRAQNIAKNTPTNTQTYPSSQNYHQLNASLLQNQNPSYANVYCPDSSQLVAQSFTGNQYILHQIYSQNNENVNANLGHYLPPALQCPNPFLLQQQNFAANIYQNPQAESHSDHYWAQLGKFYFNMTQIPPAINTFPYQHQPEYSIGNQHPTFQLSSDQDMQELQEIPDVNEEVTNQNVYSENAARNLSVIQITSDLNQPSTSVPTPMEQQLSPMHMKYSENASHMPDIHTEPPKDANHIEQDTNYGMDTSTSTQNSQDTDDESANSGIVAEFFQELNNLFEQMKLKTKAINNELMNSAWFDNSEILDKVIDRVHCYCTHDGDSTSTSPDASAEIRTLKRRNDRITLDDYENNSYTDDDENEDNKTDSDEDYAPNRELKRRRIRITYVLPPEYDATDTRWALLYREPRPGLKEVIPGSKVFLVERNLLYCLEASTDSCTLARHLLSEVFSKNALSICSLTGGKPPSSYQVEGNKLRPGLDKNAREAIVKYVEQVADEKKWPKVSRNSIYDSMRWKLKKMRRERALK